MEPENVQDETNICLPENSTHLSITTVLNYCKKKILNPYLRLLSFVGLRPFTYEQREPCIFLEILSYMYTFQVIAFMVIGYILQYMACFRRDRGFCQKVTHNNELLSTNLLIDIYEKTCNSSILFSFIIPSCLQLVAFLQAISVFRGSDDDQLLILMERVFLSSTNLPNGFISQKKLVKTLWWFIIISILWILLSLISVNCLMAFGFIEFKWFQSSPNYIKIILKILLVVSTLWHDIVQGSVISNYCLQAQLLTTYLHFLREKLLQYPIQPLEWMRDIENFKKMLNYFNEEIALSVCLFTIVNTSFAVSGLLWLFNLDKIDIETFPIAVLSVLNVSLWIIISMAPFIQAARLTKACEVIKSAGQEARIRPFVHQDTPAFELDTVLMYTTSLKIQARLYYMPIDGKYLCFFITALSITILVLGQCHYFL